MISLTNRVSDDLEPLALNMSKQIRLLTEYFNYNLYNVQKISVDWLKLSLFYMVFLCVAGIGYMPSFTNDIVGDNGSRYLGAVSGFLNNVIKALTSPTANIPPCPRVGDLMRFDCIYFIS